MPDQSPLVSLEVFDDFAARLRAFDWFYQYSDDHRVWRNVTEAWVELVILSRRHQTLMNARDLYSDWIHADRNIGKPDPLIALRKELAEAHLEQALVS